MAKKYILALLLVVLIGWGLFLSSSTKIGESDGIKVAASFYPLYFFTKEVGGDQLSLVNLTPAGAEPHDHELTAQDLIKIQTSQLLILNGGGLEAWGEKVKENIDSQKTLVVTAGEGLTTTEVVEKGEKIIDPHIWLSPVLAKQMVDKILAGLVRVDPIHQTVYEAKAQALIAKLAALDGEYKQGLATCQEKDIITSHAAFGYLAATYGLNQVPMAGLSSDAEPSPQQLAAIAQFARDRQVKYIFFESLVSPKLSQTIATEVGAKTLVLNPIEGLTNKELASGQDYFTVMRSNLANLQLALQCQK